jgi:hypothetical protein
MAVDVLVVAANEAEGLGPGTEGLAAFDGQFHLVETGTDFVVLVDVGEATMVFTKLHFGYGLFLNE